MADQPQSYAHHARFIPLFHFGLSLMLLANLVFSVVHVWKHPGYGSAVGVMVAVALLLIYGYMRGFAVHSQDRMIRLEETLRMERILPADLKARAGQLTVKQLIGLRFASDGELPALVGKALDEKLSQKAIKQAVTTWRPDEFRV